MTTWYKGIVGLISVVAAVVIGVSGWVVYSRIDGAEAAVENACRKMEVSGHYDMAMRYLGKDGEMKIDTQYAEKSFAGTVDLYSSGVKVEGGLEVVFDGLALYMRRDTDTQWTRSFGEEEHPLFHSVFDSLCPNLDDTTFKAEETVGGASAKKYTVDDIKSASSWTLWVNDEGWIVQVEELAYPDTDGEYTVLYTISGMGETNTITIPTNVVDAE